MIGRRKSQKNIRVHQNAVTRAQSTGQARNSFSAVVLEVHHTRLTCDVRAGLGDEIRNIPVRGHGGITDDEELFGYFPLPEEGDTVLVEPVNARGGSQYVITGTFMPFLFARNKSAVNSSNKAYTKSVFPDEAHDERHVFRSGTTVEVTADGTYILETPNGNVFKFSEGSDDVILKSAGKVVINDHLEIDP